MESIPYDLFYSNPQIVSMNSVLEKTALSVIPEDLFSRNPRVKDFAYAFYQCPNISEIPQNLFSNNSNVTTFTKCFYCSIESSDGSTVVTTYNKIHDFDIKITSNQVKYADNFIIKSTQYTRTVRLPAGSLTYTTFYDAHKEFTYIEE